MTQAVYRKIVAYMAANEGRAPTHHEIASGVGIGEGGHIRYHLLKLEKAGLLLLLPGVKRGIRLPEEPSAPKAEPVNPYEHFISQWGGAQP